MPDRIRSRVTALGGGHGLAATLSAVRRVVSDVTAVVTVADNGGSSGRLRDEFGVLPPGDLRMALSALCGDDETGRQWAEVVQHRFGGHGDMQGHAIGNLLIVGLWDLLGDHVAALDLVGRLLSAEGRVLPMSTTPIDITAEVEHADGSHETVRGQVEVATTTGRIVRIDLLPAQPEACPEAVTAIKESDWVLLGPGSWYTSLIPHLMVPDLAAAICASEARVGVVLNLADQPGETGGLTPQQHLDALVAHAPNLRLDAVVVDDRLVSAHPDLTAYAEGLGARLVTGDVAVGDGTPRHDPAKLGQVLRRLIAGEGR